MFSVVIKIEYSRQNYCAIYIIYIYVYIHIYIYIYIYIIYCIYVCVCVYGEYYSLGKLQNEIKASAKNMSSLPCAELPVVKER